MRVRLRREHLGQKARARITNPEALTRLPSTGDEIEGVPLTDSNAIQVPHHVEAPVKKTSFGDQFRYRFDNVMARGPIAIIGLLALVTFLFILVIAAITSLSVACRYASRPPSVPTNLLPIKNLASRPGSLAFGALFSRALISPHVSAQLSCQPAATACQPETRRLSLCGNTEMHGRVTSTKIVTRGVTFYVVSPLDIRRFAAALHSSQKFFRTCSARVKQSPNAVTHDTRLC